MADEILNEEVVTPNASIYANTTTGTQGQVPVVGSNGLLEYTAQSNLSVGSATNTDFTNRSTWNSKTFTSSAGNYQFSLDVDKTYELAFYFNGHYINFGIFTPRYIGGTQITKASAMDYESTTASSSYSSAYKIRNYFLTATSSSSSSSMTFYVSYIDLYSTGATTPGLEDDTHTMISGTMYWRQIR